MTKEEALIKVRGYLTDYLSLEDSNEIDEIIEALQPKPRVGHWVKYSIPRCGEQHYQCTSCGYYINFGQWGEFYTKEFKYCPSCGADMKDNENTIAHADSQGLEFADAPTLASAT